MDADTRPNTQLLAHVGARGATAADLYKALGWPRERLDAALKGLRASRLLVLRDGRFFQPHLLPVPQDPPPAPKPKRKRNQKNERPMAEYIGVRRAAMFAKWEVMLRLRDKGLTLEQIARRVGGHLSAVERQFYRARKWDKDGRPADWKRP